MFGRRVLIGCVLAAAAVALTGCNIIDLLNPTRTTVRLVNNSDFEVRVKLFYGDNQNAPRDVLTAAGNELEFTLAPGESQSFSRDCNDLQVIVVDDAELRVLAGIGPHASSGVLRDGEDFNCRDTITFTFDHSDVLIDFDVSTNVQQ